MNTLRNTNPAPFLRMIVAMVILLPVYALAGLERLQCFSESDELPGESFSIRIDRESGFVEHAGPHRTTRVQAIFTRQQVIYQFYGTEMFGSQPLEKYVINTNTRQVSRFTIRKRADSETTTTQTATGHCTAAE